jgi:hypothetical protein
MVPVGVGSPFGSPISLAPLSVIITIGLSRTSAKHLAEPEEAPDRTYEHRSGVGRRDSQAAVVT